MASSDPRPHESKRYDEPFDNCRLLLGLLYCFLLPVLLGGVSIAVSIRAPWAGFVLSVLALPVWVLLGPPPMPGLLNGLLCVSGCTTLFICAVVAFVRALYWTFAG